LRRLLLEAITMTASDLSASAKPWELQVKTVKVIFQEFYEQVNKKQTFRALKTCDSCGNFRACNLVESASRCAIMKSSDG
jgi:3'5'-cyclic nucleotide phosphodiesterase